jgi:hypothetical protein
VVIKGARVQSFVRSVKNRERQDNNVVQKKEISVLCEAVTEETIEERESLLVEKRDRNATFFKKKILTFFKNLFEKCVNVTLDCDKDGVKHLKFKKVKLKKNNNNNN